MTAGSGSLRPPIINSDEGNNEVVPIDIPEIAPSTTGDNVVDPVPIIDGTHEDRGGT